jgi:anti-anti-sigma regulatory factor
MAKYRHRIFEMYELRDEAIDALTPKSARLEKTPSDPSSWSFKRLAVWLSKNVTHVQLTETHYSDAETESDLRSDVTELAKSLASDSKVLLDFSGVESFSSTAIDAITLLNRKLQSKGSSMALCCLGPGTREAFFTPIQRNP